MVKIECEACGISFNRNPTKCREKNYCSKKCYYSTFRNKTEKECPRCKKVFPLTTEYWYRDNYTLLNLSTYCKKCDSKRSKKWERENKERRKITNREWSRNNKKRIRGYNLSSKFNISHEDYLKIFKKQNGKCAICGSEEKTLDGLTRKIKKLGIDHNHKTKEIRGLLCNSCNQGCRSQGWLQGQSRR